MQENGGSSNETVLMGAPWGLAEDPANIFRKSVGNW